MKNKEIEEFVDLLYPFFIKKLKEDNYFKNNVKMKNATVVSVLPDGESNIEKSIAVKFPYDNTSFEILNKTGIDLNKGDLICLMYWVDLKNAVAMFKIN